jgi:hypothetical protein
MRANGPAKHSPAREGGDIAQKNRRGLYARHISAQALYT